MGTLLFGKQETLTCITNVDLRGSAGEALCLGFKTSSYFVGAGLYLHDDGYVLKVRDKKDLYVPVSAARLSELQAEGSLPSPLPAYSISIFEYAFGYSLWIVLLGVAVVTVIQSRLAAKRRAEDARTPISFGPPVLQTKADRFVADQANAILVPGEVVQHQAYALTEDIGGSVVRAAAAKAFYAVLTDRRLLLFSARTGAFGPLLENRGTEEIDRSSIVGIGVADRSMSLALAAGGTRTLWVHTTGKLSNQRAFLRDVPRILVGGAAARVEAA